MNERRSYSGHRDLGVNCMAPYMRLMANDGIVQKVLNPLKSARQHSALKQPWNVWLTALPRVVTQKSCWPIKQQSLKKLQSSCEPKSTMKIELTSECLYIRPKSFWFFLSSYRAESNIRTERHQRSINIRSLLVFSLVLRLTFSSDPQQFALPAACWITSRRHLPSLFREIQSPFSHKILTVTQNCSSITPRDADVETRRFRKVQLRTASPLRLNIRGNPPPCRMTQALTSRVVEWRYRHVVC